MGALFVGVPRWHVAQYLTQWRPACGATSERIVGHLEEVPEGAVVCEFCCEHLANVRVPVQLQELKALRELALRHEEEFQAIFNGGLASLIETEYRRTLEDLLSEQT